MTDSIRFPNREVISCQILSTVAISSIAVGTQVLAHNEQTKIEIPQKVTATMKHNDPVIVHLEVETSQGGLEKITTTPEHPFYALLEPNKKANGTWVNAGELERGNWLRRANNDYGVVRKVSFEAKATVMYNLTVAKDHTFFVGDGQWLVHNSGECFIVWNAAEKRFVNAPYSDEQLAANAAERSAGNPKWYGDVATASPELVQLGQQAITASPRQASMMLRELAEKAGYTVESGGSHLIVKDAAGRTITVIPNSAGNSSTNRQIVKDILGR